MTDIIHRLSSRQNDRTENSNKNVAVSCIENPVHLEGIALGFKSEDRKLRSDCIEVFTLISEKRPDLIAPFFTDIVALIRDNDNKCRWEAVHTLSYITRHVPDSIMSVLPDLTELIERDNSVIVRDYALDTVARYSNTGSEAAIESFPILVTALEMYHERHAKQIFEGFINILNHELKYCTEIKRLVEPYLTCNKKVAANLAKKIIKKIENER